MPIVMRHITANNSMEMRRLPLTHTPLTTVNADAAHLMRPYHILNRACCPRSLTFHRTFPGVQQPSTPRRPNNASETETQFTHTAFSEVSRSSGYSLLGFLPLQVCLVALAHAAGAFR